MTLALVILSTLTAVVSMDVCMDNRGVEAERVFCVFYSISIG